MDLGTFEFIRKLPVHVNGSVYVVSNHELENQSTYKVGMTRQSVAKRLSTMNTSHLTSDRMHLVHCVEFEDARLAERMIHYALSKHRVSSRREFFKCELGAITACFEKVTSIMRELKGE